MNPRITFFICGLLISAILWGEKPAEIEDVSIEEKLGQSLDLSLRFQDETGNWIRLAEATGGKPALLIFAYYTCPKLCSVVLDGMSRSLKDLPWKNETRYRVLTVSMDPEETLISSKNYRDKYLEESGLEPESWRFLISPDNQVKQLAEQAGFHYRYDERLGEYLHGAGAFVLSPEGQITRVLYGIGPRAVDLKLSILEAAENKTRSNLEKALLFCFTYDPNQNSYVVHAKNLMKLSGVFTVLVLITLFFALKKNEPAAMKEAGNEIGN